VQLPLPRQVYSKQVLMASTLPKMLTASIPSTWAFFRPSVADWCHVRQPSNRILKRSNIAIAGQEAVVVGRSDIVGKPAAMLLLNANATLRCAIRRRMICLRSAAAPIFW